MITEQELNKIKHQSLYEFFGSRQFNRQKELVKILPNPEGNVRKVIRNPELFPGTVYTNKSRLPERRWSIFKKRSKTPTHGGFLTYEWDYVFILGYQLEIGNEFYEIWYDTYTTTYIVLDKFGTPLSSNHRTLDSVMTAFVDIISEDNPTIDQDNLDPNERDYLEKLAYRNLQVAKEEVEAAVTGLLEYSSASRAYLTDILNNQVKEYNKTKMDRRATKDFWKFWGKFVELPQQYLSRGLSNVFRKIIGREKVATFIIGFSLNNRIDVEIWYVKDKNTGIGSYYVFDLAGKEIIAEDLYSIRQAYKAVGDRIALPRDILDRIR